MFSRGEETAEDAGGWRQRGRKRSKGGEAGWEGSAAGCCPGHTTCLPDVPCPAVAPGLRAGSLTLVQAQLECCGNIVCVCVRVCMTVCVSECECLCGKSLPHRRPTIIPCGSPFLEHPPTYPFNNPLPHPLCPLARHVLTEQPP